MDIKSGTAETATAAATKTAFSISSPAFKDRGDIPGKYTCKGEDVSPPLVIRNVPEGTKSLALIVDDPDAPAHVWTHWLVWNIRPDTGKIESGDAPSGSVVGINDFRRNDYGGPCPPSGTHRYFFKLYALGKMLDLKTGATKEDLESAMRGHIIQSTQIVGLFSK
ncbi:MAG: YbhB/YbcL family Raf kinase inhibitor-like protein [Nitrospiraceae bacterium]|nr:YbhB/YbcL family Raf kinase inhibitor-like protein [Nitrospiraceae bacterium]